MDAPLWKRLRRALLPVLFASSLRVCAINAKGITLENSDTSASNAEATYKTASDLLQKRRPNAAIVCLRSVLDPQQCRSRAQYSLCLLLAEAYRAAHKDDSTAQIFQSLITANPEDADLRFRLAATYRSLNSLDRAVAEYRAGLRLAPHAPSGLRELGRTLLQLNKADEAIPLFEEYLKLQPDDPEGYYLCARALAATEEWARSRAMFVEATRRQPDHFDTRYQFGLMLYKSGKPEAALKELDAAKQLRPGVAGVHTALARVLSALGNKESSHEESTLAESLLARQNGIDRASYSISVGNDLLRRGDLKAAEQQFREALDADPQSARAHSNLGLVLSRLHQVVQSQAELKLAIKLDPELAIAYNALGINCLQQKQFTEARAAFERAIEIEPEYAEAKSNLGALYAESGENERAIDLFEQSTEDASTYPQSYLNWGLVLASEGQVSQARTMLEKALALSPDLPQARQALQLLSSSNSKPH